LLSYVASEGQPVSTRGNPFEELERFFERMNRQFGDVSPGSGTREPFGQSTSGAEPMAIDLVEHDEEFVVTVDLPGFERDDVDVRVTDHTLRIDAEHEERTDEDAEQYLRRERRHESASRSMRLPDAVETRGVTARMNNGVLTITLPKVEGDTARTIDIE
jgi:HSP20 family protein